MAMGRLNLLVVASQLVAMIVAMVMTRDAVVFGCLLVLLFSVATVVATLFRHER